MNKSQLIPVALLSTGMLTPAIGWAKSPEQIMRANCGSCHGADGEGGTSWIDPSQRAFKIAGRPTRSIKKWVREGRPPEMPMFSEQEISDNELNALADYINGLPGTFISPPQPENHIVEIRDEDPWFYPMQLEINPNETVKFVNHGSTYHPTTQLEFVASKGANGVDSGLLGVNGVYYHTFTEPGVYTFLCKIHPYMRVQVFVGESITPSSNALHDPQPLPAGSGTGEIWVEAQFQDTDSGMAPNIISSQDPGKDGVIHVIDASTWQASYEIEVGNNPHNIWFSQGGTQAVITNWFDNYLTEIDADSKEVLNNHIAGAAPAHITSDHAGNNFYVSIEGSKYVQIFDQRRMRLTGRIPVSGYGPHGIWYGGDVNLGTGKIMTSNSLDNTVSFIDPSNDQEIDTLDAGLYPLGAGLDSNATRGYAGNCLDGTVSIYNLESDPIEKMTDLYIGGCPVQAPVSPDNRYVVVPNSPYTTVINTADNTIAAQFFTGNGAHGAAFSRKADDSGYYAYVTHKTENYLSVIDLPDDGSTPTHAGDIPLNSPTADPETEKQSIFGITDTGGNGIATRPLASPWQ